MPSTFQLNLDQSPRSGSDYPIIAPADTALAALADLQVMYPPLASSGSFRITRAFGFGSNGSGTSTNAADLLILDDEDNVIVDTETATEFSANAWGSDYTILRWRMGSFFIVAVRHNDYLSDNDLLVTGNYYINPRTLRAIPAQVTQLEIYNGNSSDPIEVIPAGAKVNLRGGFNLDLKASDAATRTNSGLRLGQEITLNVEPGAGVGTFYDCGGLATADAALRKVGDAEPDRSGDIYLDADTCFRVEPDITIDGDGNAVIEPGRLRIADDCLPCCDCPDFYHVYLAMQRLKTRQDNLADVFDQLRQKYNLLSMAVHERMQCVNQYVSIRAITQFQCAVSITVTVCNPTEYCLENVSAKLTATLLPVYGADEQPEDFRSWNDTAVLFLNGEPAGEGAITDGPRELSIAIGDVPPKSFKSAAFNVRLGSTNPYRICARVGTSEACGVAFINCESY